MGSRGPIPKRSDRRLGHGSKAEAARVDRVAVAGPAVPMPPADGSWHPLAAGWYRSLGESGQARFYEPSDWVTAKVWAEVLSRQLAGGRVSAQRVATWAAGATELLTTEGSRRRARVELARGSVDQDEAASVTALADYVGRLGPGPASER